ncbi:MAG TPA: hypothetical protein VFK65_23100, partial [Candidatus Binatia bacterium]|nr:hypothetical protein [Candidatus Binatia bacterium]
HNLADFIGQHGAPPELNSDIQRFTSVAPISLLSPLARPGARNIVNRQASIAAWLASMLDLLCFQGGHGVNEP